MCRCVELPLDDVAFEDSEISRKPKAQLQALNFRWLLIAQYYEHDFDKCFVLRSGNEQPLRPSGQFKLGSTSTQLQRSRTSSLIPLWPMPKAISSATR